MRKCRICKSKFEPKRSTLEVWCSPDCGYKYAVLKKEQKEKREWNKRKKEMKVKVTNWKSKLQDEINKIARLIDVGQPCLATGNYTNQQHGGHIYARGGNSNMRFHLGNIFIQAANSNHWQNDDRLMHEGVKREFGEEYYEWLTELKSMPQVKYSNEEYHDFTTKAREIVRRLEKENKVMDNRPRSAKHRIALRNAINAELNIYPIEYCIFEINKIIGIHE